MKKKPEIIKVERMVAFDGPVFDVLSLETLTKRFTRIFESPDAYFVVADGSLIRCKKPNFRPVIRKCLEVHYNPEVHTVILPPEELLNIAKENNAEVYETHESYLLLNPSFIFIGRKEEGA